ncbi:MAG: hypothetical protein IKW49_01830 [Opitutales bacterium]|nr:hypothetical protein [Opitutales bacterium]
MQNDLSNTSNTSIAGDMLNPSATLSVDAPVARKPVFASTPDARASLAVPTPQETPLEETIYAESHSAAPDRTPYSSFDTLGYKVYGDGEFKAIKHADAPKREALRSMYASVDEWKQNRNDNARALRACYSLHNILMPGATPEDTIAAMQGEWFGVGTRTPVAMASRLEQIVGSSLELYKYAKDLEDGRISKEEAMSKLLPERVALLPEGARVGDVSYSMREQGLLDDASLKRWHYAASMGLKPNEAFAAFMLSDSYRTATDKNGVADSAPMVFKHFGVSPARAQEVAKAVNLFAGFDDSGMLGQGWDAFAGMAGTMVPDSNRAFLAEISPDVKKFLETEVTSGDALYNLRHRHDRDADSRRIEFVDSAVEEANKRGAKITKSGLNYDFGSPYSVNILKDVLGERLKAGEDDVFVSSTMRTELARNYSNPSTVGQVGGNVLAAVCMAVPALLGRPEALLASSAAFASVAKEDTATRAIAGGASIEDAETAGKIAAGTELALESGTGFALGKIFGIAKGARSLMSTPTGRGVVEGMDLAAMNNTRLSDLFVAPSFGVKVARGVEKGLAAFGTEMATESLQNANQEGIISFATGGSYVDGAVKGFVETLSPESLATIALTAATLGGVASVGRSGQSRQERAQVWEMMKNDPRAMAILEESGLWQKPSGIENISELTGEEQSNAINSYMKMKLSERATYQALYALDSATDANALTKSGEKLTLAPDAFVNRVMLGDEDGVRYDPEWGTNEKKEFLREKAGDGGIKVNKELIRGLDILSTASEIAAKNIKLRVAEAQKNDAEGIDFAGETSNEGAEEHGAILLSDDVVRELSAGFLSRKYDMGDADITKEVENTFMGGQHENVDENVVKALQGIRERALTPYQFSAALDAYARSCAPDLRTRTTAENRADRLGFFGISHAGVLSDPDSGFDVYTRDRYMVQSSPVYRAPIFALSEAQRSKMASMLGKIFVGTEVQIGGPVPEWASAGAKIAAENGEINGIYVPGKAWISDSSFVGTGLHEAVWHATWNWAKQSAPDLFKKMEEFAAKAPRWLREEVAGAYETDFDVSTDEIGAFLFENEFEEEFLEKLVQDKEASGWFDGVKNLFKKAFSKMRGKKPDGDAEWKEMTAHDAVRELMAEFLDGAENTQAPAANEKQGGERFSAAAAAAMNRSGGIPDGKTPKEVAAGIEANNKAVVTGALPQNVESAFLEWIRLGTNQSRRLLAKEVYASIPDEKRVFQTKDGRQVVLTSKGIADVLQHLSARDERLARCAVELLGKISSFIGNAEEFYRETKNDSPHCNFGGVVSFDGELRYVVATLRSSNGELRLKAINTQKQNELGGKQLKAQEGFQLYSTKLNTVNALRWILSNQDKSADDFRYWLQGYGDPAQESYSRVRVFHGSPYRFSAENGNPFGRFRDYKMGTGEGRQTFGWGHYLTESEQFAREYAEGGARYQDETFNKALFRETQNKAYEIMRPLLPPEDIEKRLASVHEAVLSKLGAGDNLRYYSEFLASICVDMENLNERVRWMESDLAEREHFAAPEDRAELAKERAELEEFRERVDALHEAYLALTEVYYDFVQRSTTKPFGPSDARRHLYTAEFDDETLLDWLNPVTKDQQMRIADAVREAGFEEEADALVEDAKHGTLYTAREFHEVGGILGFDDPSARSKLLHRAGFVGHKFPALGVYEFDYSGGTSYVVYDQDSLNIVDAERWSRTAGADNSSVRRQAMISAAKMIARGNGDTVPLFAGTKTMSPQDRQRVVAQARKLYIMATSAYGKAPCDIDEAGKRVVAADKQDRTQGVIMGSLRESAAGTDTERKAIERVNAREREPQRDEETGLKPEVSDEARKLAYETRNAQRLATAARVAFGAEEAERASGSDLHSRAAAFKSHMEVLSDLFFKDGKKHAEHEIMDGLIRQAAEAGMPDELLSRLRKVRDMVAEAGRKPTEVELAQASDLIMQTLSSIDVIRLMKSRGMSMPKDTSAADRAEHSSSRAASAMNALEAVYAEDTAESLAQKTLARVAVDSWNKLAKKWGFTHAIVDPGTLVGDPKFMAKLMEAADKQIKAYEEAEADATTRSKHGALLIPERKAANMEARRLRKDIDRLHKLFRENGAFVRMLKADIEALAIEQAQGGASGRTASQIAYLRDAKTLGEVMSIGNRLLSLATVQGATWNTPYLRGRLWRLVRSLPKLDERLNDDAAYYTPEFRVFANELRNVASQWWDKSMDEIAKEIESLSEMPADDHVSARIRALQMIGGGQFMSSEMLDSAFWQIQADRDFSFIEQRANIRNTRRNVEQEAAAFCDALTANEHRGQRGEGMLKKLAQKVVPGQGFLSLGDRLRGMIKHATGEVYEQAKHFCDRMEKMLSNAASAHDRLVVEQHEWEDKTIREIFGDKWVSEMYELNNVPVPAKVFDTSAYDHSTTPGAKLSALTPMQLLHIYMTAKQKSFQAPLFVNPGAFSENHAAELEARQQYVNDAREGGELETFLKTYKGGKLWKLKEAWQKRWDALYPQLNRVYKDIYGFDMYDPFNEDNYYPLARAYRQTLSISTPGAVVLPVARRFQSRTINVAELDTSKSFSEIQAEQIQNTLHTLAYADAHLQAERVMMNPTVSATLKTRVRSSDLSELQKHLVNVLGMPAQQEREESSKIVSAAVSATNLLALGMNPMPVVRQMLSGASYLAESERGILASTAAMLYPLWGGKRYIQDVIRVMSDPLAKARWGEYSRMVADAALRGKVSSGAYFLKRLRNFLLAGINLGDKFTAATAGMGFYRAAYNDGISRGLDDATAHEKAMDEFMALTEASQQSRRAMNMNWLQRHTFAPVRLITQFRSNQEQAAGHQIRAIADLIANPKDARRWKTFLRKTLAYHFLYAGFMSFVVQAIYAAANGGDDDEEKTLWERIDWKEQLATLSFGGFYGNSAFFVLSQVLGLNASGPAGIAGAPAVSVPTQFVKRVSRASKETWKSMFDEDVEEKQFEEIMRMWIRTTAAGRSAYMFADAVAGKDEEKPD